jgi:hypothetical protein
MVVAITLSNGAAATLIAAAVAGAVSLIGLWLKGLRDERSRRRQHFAEALTAVVAYQEFPYAIRRRRHDQPGEERVRLSEALRQVQETLAFHQAWVDLEAQSETAEAYRAFVAATRRVAGGYMRAAWDGEPTSRDEQMNITDIDYSELRRLQAAYLEAVAIDLSPLRRWRGRVQSRRSRLITAVLALVVIVAVTIALR